MTREHEHASPDPSQDDTVAAAMADLERRPLSGDEPIEVVHVETRVTRVLLRRGDRVWTYETGPDGIPILQGTGEKDGGQRMVRPPRMDV